MFAVHGVRVKVLLLNNSEYIHRSVVFKALTKQGSDICECLSVL